MQWFLVRFAWWWAACIAAKFGYFLLHDYVSGLLGCRRWWSTTAALARWTWTLRVQFPPGRPLAFIGDLGGLGLALRLVNGLGTREYFFGGGLPTSVGYLSARGGLGLGLGSGDHFFGAGRSLLLVGCRPRGTFWSSS